MHTRLVAPVAEKSRNMGRMQWAGSAHLQHLAHICPGMLEARPPRATVLAARGSRESHTSLAGRFVSTYRHEQLFLRADLSEVAARFASPATAFVAADIRDIRRNQARIVVESEVQL